MPDEIRKNALGVLDRMTRAAERAGRDPKEVKLCAVSKTHSADAVRAAIDAGLTCFGENKVVEAEEKISEVGGDGIEWHFIGHLQSNKARRAAQLFDLIHTVDSADLASRLSRICVEEGRESLPVLIQVDLAGEATKSGVPEADAAALIAHAKTCERLVVKGLMTLPPFFDDAELTRPFFKRLAAIRDELLPGGELSMGMTHDLEVAVEEGATIVRVGTAIFGVRGS